MTAIDPPTSTPFDLTGPLPSGTTVLEASAGTGKTYTIAALTTRYVAQGLAELDQILMITFGRAATSELRDRVRERLVSTHRALCHPSPDADPDPLVRLLADTVPAELDRRRLRLAHALARFDSATIATTHGFCQQMLRALGLAGDLEPEAELVPDLDDVVDEVIDDVYLRRYAGQTQSLLSVRQATMVGRAAVTDPTAVLAPPAAPPTGDDSATFPAADLPAAERVEFAAQVRAELLRRKRARRIVDYDDLLTLLRDVLADPEGGARAARRISDRYAVVLVDEFQDTDPVQWEILLRTFHGRRTVVLVGDPKQAVYGFRGGDVVTYLSARAQADTLATLDRCRRSDPAVTAGLDRLFNGAALGEDRIVVGPVRSERTGRRLNDPAGVRIRQVTRPALGSGRSANPTVGAARSLVAADLAAEVVAQLDHGQLLQGEGWRPVHPADIAVLTRRNADAVLVRDALTTAGVPAVVSGLSSVFASPAGQDWLRLLRALEHPGHWGRVAAAALTPFVGWDAAAVAQAAETDRDDLVQRLHQWSRELRHRGVLAVLEAATAAGMAARLAQAPEGERRLTDLRHIAEALQLAVPHPVDPVSALSHWLRRRIEDSAQDTTVERSRRLATDAAAVQVVTIHASKGLEFPIVHVPFEWARYFPSDPEVLRYHDERGRRALHLGGPGSDGYDTALVRHRADERGEDLRLLYVAATRAQSQVVLWWAPSTTSANGPLSRLLFAPGGPGRQPAERMAMLRDDQVREVLGALAAAGDGQSAGDGTIRIETVDAPRRRARWRPPDAVCPPLQVALTHRLADVSWQRLSFTALVSAGAADSAAGDNAAADNATADSVTVSERQSVHVVEDEPGSPATGAPPHGGWGEVLPMDALPAGARFGTLVHAVLEHADPTADDLQAELRRRCLAAGADRFPGLEVDLLTRTLVQVLSTPLGPAVAGRRLRDFPPTDRLAELAFELPLAGGDRPGEVTPQRLRGIGALLADLLPDDDPFRHYAERLERDGFGSTPLRGYLTGSLDAVLRWTADGVPRYLVIDYKTNRLAAPHEPVTVGHYRRQNLIAAMTDADYPLQLLLYLVALHRYLRWRQPGYRPQTHLAGGALLFVRGMTGPDAPLDDGWPAGVAHWQPPGELVARLSDLLAGRRNDGR